MRPVESKCGDEDHLFFSAEINNFKATFIINLSNITCVDQFFYGDQFESIVSLLQKCYLQKSLHHHFECTQTLTGPINTQEVTIWPACKIR